jgi:hypothetical protein
MTERSWRVLAFAAPLVLALLLPLIRVAPAAAANPCGPPVVSVIACENSLPGDSPSDWQVSGAGDATIQGYATQAGVNVGQTVSFKINTPSTAYHIDILRLGYYQGNGARLIASHIPLSVPTLPQTQPACLDDTTLKTSTGLIDCGNWAVSASWTVPSTAVSGVYIAHLVRDDSADLGGESQIMFVVRNDASNSNVLVQTSDETWQAYNDYGGNSLYTCTVACPPGNPGGYKAAYAVSYNRPFDGTFVTDAGQSNFFYAEYQMVRFLEENGYDVSYTNEANVDQNGALLKNHKAFISSAHDEYWSPGQRANVTAARDAGVNLAFFSGNEAYWKTRWASSSTDLSTPDRTLTTYKETHFDAPTDPQDPSTWTGTWADPRFSPPADGGRPQNALTGQFFNVNSGTSDITVPSQYSKLRVWRNTAVASLSAGQSVTLGAGQGTLGYEWDVDADNGFRPAGLFDLSSTTVAGVSVFTDYGTNVANGTDTHHLTQYRAPSGALVFGAGTVQWSWGLDNTNAVGNAASFAKPLTRVVNGEVLANPGTLGPLTPGSAFTPVAPASAFVPSNPADVNMQQATVNLLADMGAQPATLLKGLTATTASSDTTPPSSTIGSPAAGANLADGSSVTITGTAHDAAGGVVAGVEVSTDGGTTWHPASIPAAAQTVNPWSYTWIAHGNPTTTILSRAVDDSGNVETPSAGVNVNVNCSCSLWGSLTPPTPDSGDTNSTEVGVKFKSDVGGNITGIRFYKSTANTGTHIGNLWSASGTLLATATFTGESASGWQTVSFQSPVAITAGTTYVASYFAPKGHYASAPGYFYPLPSPEPLGGGSVDSPPLHALRNNISSNGAYVYSSTTTFPNLTFNAENYYVDVNFLPAGPATVPAAPTGVTATAGNGSATVSWTAPSNGGSPITSYTVTPFIAGVAQPATTVTGSPPATSTTITGLTNGTAYTFTVKATNAIGTGPPSTASSAVTPTAPTVPAAPTNVTATAGNGSANVSWTAPANGGSPITSYTITPYIGSTAQTATTITGSPPATSTTITGLTNGTSYTFTVKATNAIGTGPPSTASNAVTPQNTIVDTIFGLATPSPPAVLDSGDPNAVELGVQFQSSVSGNVTGIRFYKATTNTGIHIGSLWTTNGNLMASATFSNESASGWQTVSFSSPVAITANMTYVAGYFAPNGHYSDQEPGFTSGVSNAPLQALANNSVTPGNGVYAYGSSSAFPTNTFNATNYYVDVTFSTSTTATAPAAPTGVTATAGNGSATVSWTAPSNGGSPITSYTVTPFIAGVAQPATTVTGSPPATSTTITGLTNGTAYTFTVKATNAIGTGPPSTASSAVTPTAPTVPAAPTNVTATAGNGSANVSWTAPANGGSPITSYTITPYIGSTAQTATTITGSPPATSTNVTGLTNGTSYTFKVTATNAVGTGPLSAASNAVTPSASVVIPAFVQQVSSHAANVTTGTVTPSSNITAVNRLVVLVGVWSSSAATAKSVTDSAGNTYTEVLHFKASDQTEESVWTAPINAGGGTKPKITVTPTSKADVGVAALEYSGLSAASGAGSIDQTSQGTGTTGAATTVSSGATPATTASNELALGFYVDSGFGDTLTAGTGFTARTNVSNTPDMELLAEDQFPAQGATPNASAGTGANTVWLMSTVVFKHGP